MKVLLAHIVGIGTMLFGAHHAQIAKNVPAEPVVQVQEVYTVTVPILTYHTIAPYTGRESANQKRFKVDPKILDKQFTYLRDHDYTVIPITDVVDALQQGTELPEKAVVLTFDDGDDTQYQNALPLLKQYNYPATFFIYTIVLGKKHFMTWDQVRELDAQGMTIGGHTKNHAYVTKITDDAVLQDEIAGGKKLIEEKLGHAISVFAYPFYQTNERAQQFVEKAGYSAGFAGWQPGNSTSEHMYALKRVEVGNDLTKFPGLLKY